MLQANDSILIFSLSNTPYWLSVYHSLTGNHPIIHSLTIFSLSFTPYLHSVHHSILTGIQSIIHSLLTFSLSFTPCWQPAWRNKIFSTITFKEFYVKPHNWTQQQFVGKLLTFWTSDVLKKFVQSAHRRGCQFDDPRFWIPAMAKVFSHLTSSRTALGPNSLLISMYWSSSTGKKRSSREPNKSPVSSAQVMTHNTKLPLVLTFAVKWTADNERCASAWNWDVR